MESNQLNDLAHHKGNDSISLGRTPTSGVKMDELVSRLVRMGGSDLHLKAGVPPGIRAHGLLQPLEEYGNLRPEDTEDILKEILPKRLAGEFEEEGEVDFSYEVPELGRFRVNGFRQRNAISIAMRYIPLGVPKFDELGLPEVIRSLAFEERGIILLTGTTGSGKSTTLASMIDLVNHSMHKHIVTIEDPIEYLHRDDKSYISQREVGSDTASYTRALRRVLRQDPDIILIGEIRDAESAQIALSAAETGHLVLSTVHTLDATETVNRLIDLFPQREQGQIRTMLAGTLKGIVGQRLVRTTDGKRTPACEVMVTTGRIQDFIVEPAQTAMIQQDRGGRVLRDADLRPGPPEAHRRGPDRLRGGPAAGESPPGLQAYGPGPRPRRPDRELRSPAHRLSPGGAVCPAVQDPANGPDSI
jgi:twitching motility protein PilT